MCHISVCLTKRGGWEFASCAAAAAVGTFSIWPSGHKVLFVCLAISKDRRRSIETTSAVDTVLIKVNAPLLMFIHLHFLAFQLVVAGNVHVGAP